MRRTTSWDICLLIFLTVLLGVSYALLLLLPQSSEVTQGSLRTITVNPWRGQIYLTTLIVSVVAIVFALWIVHRRKRIGWLLLALGLGSPLFCGAGIAGDLGDFADEASVRDRDGTEYHLLASNFLQGSELAIGRLLAHTPLGNQFEVIVTSPWERSFGYLAVVRPEGAVGDRKLFLTSRRQLVGVPYENMAFLGYDLGSSKPYSQIYNANEQGYADIRQLSPFLLLSVSDTPRKSDYRSLLDPEGFGRVSLKGAQADLKNPNPKVAELARRLVADLRAHPPRRSTGE